MWPWLQNFEEWTSSWFGRRSLTRTPSGIVIYVNLLPHPPTDWGLSKSALGGVRRDEAGSSPVFIFYPAVEQVLGVPGDDIKESRTHPSLPQNGHFGLARIIAHEILHVLLPEKSHDRSGIFTPDLKRSTLLSQELKLENKTELRSRSVSAWVDPGFRRPSYGAPFRKSPMRHRKSVQSGRHSPPSSPEASGEASAPGEPLPQAETGGSIVPAESNRAYSPYARHRSRVTGSLISISRARKLAGTSTTSSKPETA